MKYFDTRDLVSIGKGLKHGATVIGNKASNLAQITGSAARNAVRGVQLNIASARLGAGIGYAKYIAPKVKGIAINARTVFTVKLPQGLKRMSNGLVRIGHLICRVAKATYNRVRGFIITVVKSIKEFGRKAYDVTKRNIKKTGAQAKRMATGAIRKIDNAFVRTADAMTKPAKTSKFSEKKTAYNEQVRAAKVRTKATAMEFGAGYLMAKGINAIGDIVNSKEDEE